MPKHEIINNDAVTLRIAEDSPVDKAIEVVEGSIDAVEGSVERVVEITRNNPFVIAGVALVVGSAAAYIGYKIGVKRTTLRYEEILKEEIDAAKAFHRSVDKQGYETPADAVEDLVGDAEVAQAAYQGKGDEKVPYNKPNEVKEKIAMTVPRRDQAPTNNITVNVFEAAQADADRDWDMRLEIADREANPGKPYVISHEEFTDNADQHEQTTLTYYVEDDTLVDERDMPVDNVEYLVGEDNLRRFGAGSDDSNVVLVRNEQVSMDFEITKDNRSYKKHVLGLDDEEEEAASLRHSSRRRRRDWGRDE